MPHFYYSARQQGVIQRSSEGCYAQSLGQSLGQSYGQCEVKINGLWIPYTEMNDKKEYTGNFDDAQYLGEIDNPLLRLMV